MKIVTRKEAKEQGLTKYFTGKACIHGHICARRTRRAECVRCSDLYKQRWKRANPEPARRRYNEKLEERRAYTRTWYQRNKSRKLGLQKEREQKIQDLIAVLRQEAPALLKEFGL